MTADEKRERLLEIIARGQRRTTDRLIIRTMRAALWGLGAIGVLFVAYVVALLYIGARDNRRLDELQQRVERLERTHAERAP